MWEIYPLCFWEEGGQDDHSADLVLRDPNSDYSLTEARQYFRKYYTMFRPIDKVKLKKRMSQKCQALFGLPDHKRQQPFDEIQRLERKL